MREGVKCGTWENRASRIILRVVNEGEYGVSRRPWNKTWRVVLLFLVLLPIL